MTTTLTSPKRPTRRTVKPAARRAGPKRLVHAETGAEVEIVLVTPELATAWIAEHNSRNRAFSPAYVARYAADMIAGNWNFGPNGIGFDTGGNLLDGQHRLQAIIDSGTEQHMLVVRNLSPKVGDTLDIGKGRTFANVLTINGYTAPSANALAPVVSFCLRYERGALSTNMKHAGNLSHPEQFAWLNDNLRLLEIVEWVQSLKIERRKGMTKTKLAGLVFAAGDLEAEAREFVQGYSTGADLSVDSPILLFKNLMESKNTATDTPRDVWYNGIMFKAFNYYVSGKQVSKLRFAYDGNGHKKLKDTKANVEPFPTLLTTHEAVAAFREANGL